MWASRLHRVRSTRSSGSHHLDEVARIADRISVLNSGRIIGDLDPNGVEIERSFFDLVLTDAAVTT